MYIQDLKKHPVFCFRKVPSFIQTLYIDNAHFFETYLRSSDILYKLINHNSLHINTK